MFDLKKLVLFLTLFVCFASCNKNPPTTYQLKLNIEQDPASLDPRIGGDAHSSFIIDFLFDPLMRINQQGKAECCVANKVEISEDKTVYTFHLRKTTWSNADPVTAHDFEYAWKSLLKPGFPSLFAYELFVIKNAKEANMNLVSIDEVGIKALDDYTLQVQLSHPAAYFLELTSHAAFFPVHKQIDLNKPKWALQQKQQFICNGAFTLEQWNHHDLIMLKKNPLYWQADAIQFPQIKISMITSHTTQLELFERKELDWIGRPMNDLSIEIINSFHKDPQTLPVPAVTWCEFNTNKHPWTNINLRKALAFALNRQIIIKNILGGKEQAAFSIIPDSIWPNQSPLFSDGDQIAAKRLFEMACQQMGNIDQITLIVSTSATSKKIAQFIQYIIQEQFHIPVKLVSMEWKTFFDLRESSQFDLCLISWVSNFNDPICNLELFKNASNNLNATNWENANFQRLLNLSNLVRNSKLREHILKLASKKLIDEMPVIPLFYEKDYYLKQDYLKGVTISSSGVVDFRKGYKDI